MHVKENSFHFREYVIPIAMCLKWLASKKNVCVFHVYEQGCKIKHHFYIPYITSPHYYYFFFNVRTDI